MNKKLFKRSTFYTILRVNSPEKFHSFLINQSILEYQNTQKGNLGSILALGSSHVEAENLIKFPFKKILLTGINPPDEKIKKIMEEDKRLSYEIADMEKLPFNNSSFDLVFVKEALHHLPKPILGFYEMLRVSKKAVVFIEPHETMIGNILEKFGISSKYETNQKGNLKFRDNYVFRWKEKEIIKILTVYYLESGYKVVFTRCWMSNRFNMQYPLLISFSIFLDGSFHLSHSTAEIILLV